MGCSPGEASERQVDFVGADRVGGLLKDSDRMLGVFLNGEAKAYPVRILNRGAHLGRAD